MQSLPAAQRLVLDEDSTVPFNNFHILETPNASSALKDQRFQVREVRG
jgi:hypothetical protein